MCIPKCIPKSDLPIPITKWAKNPNSKGKQEMSNLTENITRPKMRLQTFANHVAMIMTQEADCKPTTYSPCDDNVARVRIEIRKSNAEPYDPIHDQVLVNNRWCGNRHGAVKEFCRIVSKANPEIIFD